MDSDPTPLHLLAYASHPAEIGASVNATENDQWTALHLAAQRGDPTVVQELIENGASVNATGKDQWTALHVAAERGDLRVVQMLLENGALVNAIEKDQWTALHVAALIGHTRVVQMLLESGISVNATEKDQWSALHVAAYLGHPNVVQMLLENGASVDAIEKDQQTALHVATQRGDPSVVQMLLENGSSVNATGKDQWTALHMAASNGHLAVVKMLLENGASVNAVEKDQWTALHVTAYEGHPTVAQMLLENGALVNATEKDQWTALHVAAQRGDPTVVQKLIKNGAWVNATEKDQQTALHVAAERGDPKVVQMLIENGVSVNATEKDQWTALHVAAQRGDPRVVQMLLENGALVNATEKDQWTALHKAAFKGSPAVVQQLIKNGASVNVAGKDQQTALHVAAYLGHPTVVQMLLENGASVNAAEKDHWTALHFAAQKGDPVAIDLLLLHRADPFASDVTGLMAVHVARGDALFAALNHMCGFCLCQKQHAVDPSKVNSADCWGRTPFQLSQSIKPFVQFYESHADLPLPCVYATDIEGSTKVQCAFSCQSIHVLKFHWNLSDLPSEPNGDKLSRNQTHILRYLLREHIDDDLPQIVDKWENFVFGSVLQGDGHTICSFPCNYSHNAKERNEMEELLSLKGNPEKLCHHLKDSFLKKCDLECRESMGVISDIEFFLEELSAFFKHHCWLLQFQWKMVGSFAENTKIGFPDEYDVLLNFTELSRYVKVNEGDIKWCGMDANVEQEMARWSPHNITAVGVKVKIFQLITDFLGEKQSWSKLSFLCLRPFKRGYSAIFHVSNLDVNIDAKVDLVPLVGDGQTWYVFKDVASPTLRDLLPSESHASNFEPESYALRELELMRSLLPSAREGYVIAKSLRDAHCLSHMMKKPILSDLVDRVLPSHVLKHALFHAFAEEGGPKEVVKPHEWAQQIFVQLRNEHLGDFFSGRELFNEGDYPHPRQMYLNRFIFRERPGHQAFLPSMTEKEYRELFINEILKMLS